MYFLAYLQASGIHRLIFSNLWITTPLLKLILAGKEETDALQRTTTAITVFNAGLKVSSFIYVYTEIEFLTMNQYGTTSFRTEE